MIVFKNPGLIDTDAAFTMGVNVKECSSPIGHFGTGLKFALATILREGGQATIWRGTEKIAIEAVEQTIRDKPFQMVTANGERLGFTTELGKGWEPWMAFRELACNALDEGGRYFSAMDPDHFEEGQTAITVTGGGIEDAYANRDGVLAEGEPIYSSEYMEVRPGETNFIYYRGVRVGKLQQRMTHRYNLLMPIELTEDRTFKHEFQIIDRLVTGLVKCDDKVILDRVLKCGEGFVEHKLNFPSWMDPSAAFLVVASSLRSNLENTMTGNMSAKKIAQERRLAKLGPEDALKLTEADQTKISRAINLLRSAGYPIDDYPIIPVETLGPDVLGLAREGQIFIARLALDKGSKEVAATLLEEWAHLRTGHGDETRALQTWLFDQILCQIERRTGQPI